VRLSVVICTHNPRPDFLGRTLAALHAQDCPLAAWELLLVDNASREPLAARWDLSWHPGARHLREEELGVAAARRRGMRAARSDLILFVDDDNLLAPDYLSRGLALGAQHPDVGVWGGQLLPDFEAEPAAWTRRWWSYLAIRPLGHDLVAAHPRDYEAIPPTAGEFIRRPVWEAYLRLVAADPRHLVLGLRGSRRISGQDTDIALCAFDVGLKPARFAGLRLTHLMPAARLQEDALLNLVESISFSTVVLEGLRDRPPPPEARSRWRYWRDCLRAWRLPGRTRRFFLAELRGRRRGARELARLAAPA
jgi:glycosyltransferase involved in cell wall biosynthesis